MKLAASVVPLCLATLVVSPVHAQDADPARLFARELDVRAPEDTVARLALPPEVLARVRPDLSDIRLYDGDVEIPYLSDSGVRVQPSWPELPREPVTPIGATRRADRAGTVESYQLPPPPPAPPHTHWALEVDTGVPEFVRGLRIESASEVVETSVFRFPWPLRERKLVRLPASLAAPLTVIVTGELDGLLPPPPLAASFVYVAIAGPIDPPRVSVPLVELSRRRDGAHTFVSLACPPGLRPDVIRIETTTPSFARDVRIAAAGREVGAGTVYRVDLPSLRDGAVLDVDVDRIAGDRIEVQITDGDSPSLAALHFVGELRQPAIVFDAPGDGLVLRFGGGRARAPRYDLATLAGLEGGRLLAADDLAEATAGPSRPSPGFGTAPALAFLGRPGVRVDAAKMTWAADVTIDDAREGVATMRVPLAIAAASRHDLGDVRVVGADGRQYPFLVDETRALVDVPLGVAEPVREGGETRYALSLPVTRAAVDSLRIDVDARFTERAFTLRGLDDDGEEVVLARDVLRRVPGETGPLVVAVGGTRVHDLVLAVEDGDDAPLHVERVVAAALTPTLVLAAPRGHYRMLTGDASLTAPVYEMARGRALIDAVPLAEAVVSRPTRNAAFRAPGFFERAGAASLALWAALLFAVLVLGTVTLRVARVEPAEARAEPPAASQTPPTETPPSGTPPSDTPSAEPPAPASTG